MKNFKRVMSIFNLNNSLSSLGIKTKLSSEMMAAITLWKGLYNAPSKLSLPASIASETARLVTVEFKSDIKGSRRAEFLNEQYKKFTSKLRIAVELACAQGGIVFKPYVKDNEIGVSLITSENFVPTHFNSSGEITGAAFLDRYFDRGKVYTRIEEHYFEADEYKIRNSAYVSDDTGSLGRVTALKSVPVWRDLEPRVSISGLSRPLFAYFKMPMANSIDEGSPFGVSVYSRCVSLIQDAEEQYKRLLWEFESGERALYIDESAIRHGRKNEVLLPEKRLYRLLNTADDTLFADWSPAFREVPIINGINEILRKIEFNAGFAYGTLSNVNDVMKTAEEIKVSKQRSYAHITDIQNSLRSALLSLVEAMNTLADLYSIGDEGAYSVSFEFDDSTASDRQTEFAEKMALLREGIIKPWEMRSWYLGEDEERSRMMTMGKDLKEETKGGVLVNEK